MTNLTASQIAIITAELTGSEPTRTATKERAIGKLRTAIASRIGEDKADTILAQALDAPTAEAASVILRGEEDARLQDAAPKQRRAALDLIEAEAPAPQIIKPSLAKDDRGPRKGTKQAVLVEMLKAKAGASIQDIVSATGWQAHTVRGAIAGTIKKKLGYSVETEAVENRGRVYRIA